MSSRSACSQNEDHGQCFLTKKNLQAISDAICKIRDLDHRAKCSSTRAKGDTTACLSAREVSPREMLAVMDDLESSTKELRDELNKHLILHELQGLRVSRGRAQRRNPDSGLGSWTPDTGVPVQEEADEGEVQVPASSPQPHHGELGAADNFGADDDIVEDSAAY